MQFLAARSANASGVQGVIPLQVSATVEEAVFAAVKFVDQFRTAQWAVRIQARC